LWQQAVVLADLGADFFLRVIPAVVALSSAPETAGAIFDDYEVVSKTLGSTANRADLSQRLMRIFPSATTNTIKGHILEWCKRLNGDASLRELDPESLTDDDVSILESKFGRSSVLKRIQAPMKT